MEPEQPPLKRVAASTADERALASKRLKQWVPKVNPDSHAHIDAYLLCRMKTNRVSLPAVLAAIKQQEHLVERSSSQDALFWVVPHTNFTNGLPTEAAKWLVTEAQLRERYELLDDGTDYDSVYIFSDACPRSLLGIFVHQLKFSIKLGRTTR